MSTGRSATILPQASQQDSNANNSSVLSTLMIDFTSDPLNVDDNSTLKCQEQILTPGSIEIENPRLIRSAKRSLSNSNDQIFESDRFRARLQTLNANNRISDQSISTEDGCEVCDGISYKTTKLNIEIDKVSNVDISPLHPKSDFYANLNITKEYVIGDIRSLTSEQLNHVFERYFNSALPSTCTMFPWLHGLNNNNKSQQRFFIFKQDALSLLSPTYGSKPKDARFFMCINTSEDNRCLRNTIDANEVLAPVDIPWTRIRELIEHIFYKMDDQVEQSVIDLLVSDCIHTGLLPLFLNLDPDKGVSLRNFHIQVAKSATCSDFLVYGDKNSSITRLLWLAQKNEVNKGEVVMFNTFVLDSLNGVKDSFFTPKQEATLSDIKKTQLSTDLLLKSDFSIWDSDFQMKEKLETSTMSSASKLNNNVWVGNMWDYQVLLKSLVDDRVKFEDSDGRHAYYDPKNSIVHLNFRQSGIDFLPLPKARWQFLILTHNEADFPSLNYLQELLRKVNDVDLEEIDGGRPFMLEFPPSGSISLGDCKKTNLTSILNTCKLLYVLSSSKKNSRKPTSSLIYCSDGYTESSLLTFFYLVYSENIGVDEAILKIHLEYGRPFYIFNTDVTMLQKLEPLLRKYSPKTKGDEFVWNELEELHDAELNDILITPSYTQKNFSLDYNILGSLDDSESSESEDEDGYTFNDNWVKDVDGTLPSRILPYLYLGSLKHANSLSLLNKLGMKKVISVGEKLDWIHGYKFKSNFHVKVEEIDDGNIEIINISPKNRTTKEQCSIETIIKVNNLQDDGKDELTSSLPSILKYIEEFYSSSRGQTKVLVHCRVGVSRSATVVIAEVMRRLGVSLARAYLYVRVRRLSIIIQPNLRFMYELFKWNEKQKSTGPYLREIDWFVMCREIMKLNTPYMSA